MIFMPFVALFVFGAMAGLSLLGCGNSTNTFTAADMAQTTNTVKLAKGCGALCLSEAGCTPDQAAGCFDAIACNQGSSLHRHGGPDLVDPDAGCK